VILIQEWWGIEPHVKDLTERLARAGYVVLAPDMITPKTVAQLEAVTALSEEQIGKLGA
jgi:carboxymethylenebutenolidase